MPDILSVLLNLLDELSKRGRVYAVIHGAGENPPGVESDVDIALGCRPNRSIDPIILRAHEEGTVELVQRLHYEIPFGYYYILKVKEGNRDRFLHLDCLYDPIGLNSYRFKTSWFLNNRIKEKWGYRASDVTTAIYLIVKRAVKASLSEEQWRELLLCLKKVDRDSLLTEVKSQLGVEAAQHVEKVIICDTFDEASSALKGLRDILTRGFKFKHPLKWGLEVLLDSLRKLTRFLKPTGTFVVMVGPDGSGKSSLSDRCCTELNRAFRRIWRFHWRPGLLPKLRKGGNEKGSEASSAPPKSARYNVGVSLARYLYYFADFILGYWLVIYPKKAQTSLVVGERWYYDVVSNPERYGFRLPRWLISACGHLLPSPDLAVLFSAQPETIHTRKPELTPDEIRDYTLRLRRAIETAPNRVEISTDEPFDDSVAKLNREILHNTSIRTLYRIGWKPRDSWIPFPWGKSPRVWIHNGEQAEHALRLYNPYSFLGRIAKQLFCRIPRVLLKAGSIWCPEVVTGDLRRLTQIVRSTLHNEGLTVSFSTGTPGPDRKMTAQASLNGSTQAYIKIASSESAKRLVENESWILNWLSRFENHDWLTVPRVLGEVSDGNKQLLFLSAPTFVGFSRPIDLDDLDQKFLNHMLPTQPKARDVDDVLSSILDGNSIAVLGEGGEGERIWSKAVEYLRKVFKENGVPVSPCHGDYAPWNAIAQDQDHFFLFDWEYGSREGVLFTDMFHRVFMPEILIERKRPKQIIERLLELVHDGVMGPLIKRMGLNKSEMNGLLVFYLLSMRQRKLNDNSFQEFLKECVRLVLLKVDTEDKRRKVLVSAYACEPDKGSEPGVGWHWVETIAAQNETWVLTRTNNRESIEQELKRRHKSNMHFEYVDLPHWMRFWKKGQRGVRIYYYLWQFAALARAKKLQRRIRFDLGHHVTFVNDWLWTFFSLMRLPYVWGPVGSNPRIMESLLPHKRARRIDKIRMTTQRIVRLIDPLYWITVIRASAIIFSNKKCGQSLAMKLFGGEKVWYETAIGIDIGDTEESNRTQHDLFKVLFVGRFVPIKGAHLAIEAFEQFLRTQKEASFVLVGSGPEEKDLLGRIKSKGIENRVMIKNWMPREEVLSEYRNADVFLFPSMEGAGMVVLEALSAGLPVICLDFGGPGFLVDSTCGYKVPVSDRNHVISRLAEGLEWIAGLQNRGESLSESAVSRAKKFAWSNKMKFIRTVYSQVLQGRFENDY